MGLKPVESSLSADILMKADSGLLSTVRQIWEGARTQVARTVNSALVQANWLIGRQLVEAQQAGKDRAGYGEELLLALSRALRAEYGTGFSVSGLQYMRGFYLAYPDLMPIQHALRVELASRLDSTGTKIGQTVHDNSGPDWKPGMLHPALSWIHYRALLKVDRRDARDFYEIEAIRNAWSGRNWIGKWPSSALRNPKGAQAVRRLQAHPGTSDGSRRTKVGTKPSASRASRALYCRI